MPDRTGGPYSVKNRAKIGGKGGLSRCLFPAGATLSFAHCGRRMEAENGLAANIPRDRRGSIVSSRMGVLMSGAARYNTRMAENDAGSGPVESFEGCLGE